jgi:hypothetical protein
MNVLGHHDLAHEREAIAVAGFAKNLNKRISRANRAQQGQASMASESDEMKMTAAVVANEIVSHGKKEKSKARPSKSGRVGHPEGQRLRKMQ